MDMLVVLLWLAAWGRLVSRALQPAVLWAVPRGARWLPWGGSGLALWLVCRSAVGQGALDNHPFDLALVLFPLVLFLGAAAGLGLAALLTPTVRRQALAGAVAVGLCATRFALGLWLSAHPASYSDEWQAIQILLLMGAGLAVGLVALAREESAALGILAVVLLLGLDAAGLDGPVRDSGGWLIGLVVLLALCGAATSLQPARERVRL